MDMVVLHMVPIKLSKQPGQIHCAKMVFYIIIIKGYYWNNQACMPCKNAGLVVGGYYTCSAYYEGTSLICNSGFTLLNG